MHTGIGRPEQPPEAVRCKEQGNAAAIEAVERPDDAQIDAAGLDHTRIVAEQAQSGVRPDRRSEADRFTQNEGDRGTGVGDAQRPRLLPGADVGADHGDQRCAKPEGERDEQVFEARASA